MFSRNACVLPPGQCGTPQKLHMADRICGHGCRPDIFHRRCLRCSLCSWFLAAARQKIRCWLPKGGFEDAECLVDTRDDGLPVTNRAPWVLRPTGSRLRSVACADLCCLMTGPPQFGVLCHVFQVCRGHVKHDCRRKPFSWSDAQHWLVGRLEE